MIGIGNISAETIRMAKPFDMQIIAYDPFADATTARALCVRLVEIDELFQISDFISVHCPLTDKTRNLVNARLLSTMKTSAYLINTTRGPIVNQAALTEALAERRIAGAGIDVFDPEPPVFDDPLLKLDNVILAPHAIAHTDQSIRGIGGSCVAAVQAVMAGKAPATVANPEVRDRPKFVEKLARYATSSSAQRI